RPRLLGCPAHVVKSVAALVFVRPKFAVGSVPAAHIFYDDCISALDCAAKDRVLLLREVLAVGRAINKHRKRPVSFGPKDVGTEQHAVTHRNGDILFRDEITSWRLRRNCASERRNDEENLTINSHGTRQSTKYSGENGTRVCCRKNDEFCEQFLFWREGGELGVQVVSSTRLETELSTDGAAENVIQQNG